METMTMTMTARRNGPGTAASRRRAPLSIDRAVTHVAPRAAVALGVFGYVAAGVKTALRSAVPGTSG